MGLPQLTLNSPNNKVYKGGQRVDRGNFPLLALILHGWSWEGVSTQEIFLNLTLGVTGKVGEQGLPLWEGAILCGG